MGFPGHFKISGHSGTDFKHRKLFSEINKYNRTRKSINKSKTNKKENSAKNKPIIKKDYEISKYDKYVRLGIKLPIFLTFLTLMIVGAKSYSNVMEDILGEASLKSKESLTIKEKEDNENAYKVLVESGSQYMKSELLDEAYFEFVRALNVDKYGKDARIGLTKVLVKKCKLKNQNCYEAELNINYLKEMNYISENDALNTEK